MSFEERPGMPDAAPNVTSPSVEAVAEIIELAELTIGDFNPEALDPQELSSLRYAAEHAVAMSALLSRKTDEATKAVLRSPRFKPRLFAELDPDIITSRLLRPDEIPDVLFEYGRPPLAITAVGERQVAANGLTYVFEQNSDNVLLAMFNTLFACRDEFPMLTVLRTTPWLQRIDTTPEMRRLEYLVNKLCPAGAGETPAVVRLSLGNQGKKVRMNKALVLKYAPQTIYPAENEDQEELEERMRSLRADSQPPRRRGKTGLI